MSEQSDQTPQVPTTSSAANPDSGPTKKGRRLYEAHKKIYVRAVEGRFVKWRWILVWLTQIVFFGLPWLTWNDRQAVLLNLVERKFYIFGWVFWPQDVFFLTLLLIISAYSLFFFTAIAGRLWCGYACPQTVYTEIFLWIEQKIEGDHAKRAKLDTSPMSGRKLALKTAKYAIWGLFALWTGFTLVAYFSPLKELLAEARTLSFGPSETFWMLFYAAFTFLFAGFMREQVCKFMCPYARFQSAMFDQDTLIITYDEARGEPRGVKRKGDDTPKGDCVDCGICVQVCPTGIDIRNGLQYECIGCAACVDACDEVMLKMNKPLGLVRYTTEHAMKAGWGKAEILRHVRRPRIVLYSLLLFVVVLAFIWGLATRIPLRVDVIRDRGLGKIDENGLVENKYTLSIMNMTEAPRTYSVDVTDLPGAKISGETSVTIGEAKTDTMLLTVVAPPDETIGPRDDRKKKIHFVITANDDPGVQRREASTFTYPR